MRFLSVNFFFICLLTACQSPAVGDYRDNIVKNERTVFNILVGKDGENEKKQKSIIAGDYDAAVKLSDQEKSKIDRVINNIQSTPTDDVKYGEELKKSAIAYYSALRDLHYADHKVILLYKELQMNHHSSKVSDSIISLEKMKRPLFDKVYSAEKNYQNILEKFDEENRIK